MVHRVLSQHDDISSAIVESIVIKIGDPYHLRTVLPFPIPIDDEDGIYWVRRIDTSLDCK